MTKKKDSDTECCSRGNAPGGAGLLPRHGIESVMQQRKCGGAEAPRPQKVMALSGGPNRIGQGIAFDSCCAHATFARREKRGAGETWCAVPVSGVVGKEYYYSTYQ